MTSFKKSLVALSAVFGCCFALSAFAADMAAKEDSTPPAAEGAMTPDQTPSVTDGAQRPAAQQ